MPSVGTGSQPRRMASFSSSRLKWKFKDRTIEEIGTSHSHKLIRERSRSRSRIRSLIKKKKKPLTDASADREQCANSALCVQDSFFYDKSS